MKKQLIFLLLGLAMWNIGNSQDYPRRFTKTFPMCPVDYAILTTEGITPTSLVTVGVITETTTLQAGSVIRSGAIMTGVANTIIRTDTVFRYSVISKKGMAFDIVQPIGSFTLIKLWSYKKSSGAQISEYKLAEEQKPAKLIGRIAKQIEGVRNVTAMEVSAKTTSSTLTTTIQVDPSSDFYLVKTSDLDSKTEEFEYKKGAWNIGLMYLPVKVRPFATQSGAFDFSSDISVGTSFSWTLMHNFKTDATFNLLLYTGVSSVKVDSLIAGDTTFRGSQNITAFSPALGVYWEKKGIQLGVAFGMDLLAGHLQKTWAYRGMPWISLTAGVNLFKLTNNSSDNKGTNKN